jgi:hypothetical protein
MWAEFAMRAGLVGSNAREYPIFVHELTSRTGNRRLVCVNLLASESLRIGNGLGPMLSVMLLLRPQVIVPGTLTRLPVEVGPSATTGAGVSSKQGVRVYFGELDQTDPARFVIRYELDGEPASFEGVLLDDDSIQLKRLEGK